MTDYTGLYWLISLLAYKVEWIIVIFTFDGRGAAGRELTATVYLTTADMVCYAIKGTGSHDVCCIFNFNMETLKWNRIRKVPFVVF